MANKVFNSHQTLPQLPEASPTPPQTQIENYQYALLCAKKRCLAELCITGYLRDCLCKEEKDKVPRDLVLLCVSMYFISPDTWNANIGFSELRYTTNTVIYHQSEFSKFSGFNYKWPNAMGTIIVQKGEIRTWKIKIINTFSHYVDFYLGFMDTNRRRQISEIVLEDGCSGSPKNIDLYKSLDKGYKCAGFVSYGNKNCEEGDIISMTLDMSTGNKYAKLSYKINNKHMDAIFKTDSRMSMDTKYHMAITFVRPVEIELIQ